MISVTNKMKRGKSIQKELFSFLQLENYFESHVQITFFLKKKLKKNSKPMLMSHS